MSAQFAGGAAAADSELSRFSLDDLSRLTALSVPSLNADGSIAALVVSRPDPDEDHIAQTLVLVDTRSGAQRVLAQGEIDSALFSPRGDQIAFLKTDTEKTSQIMVLPLGAEPSQAPRAVTQRPKGAGVRSFAWSPDGRRFAFLAREAPAAATGAARFDRSFEVAPADYLGTSYLDRNAGPAPTRLWTLDTAGGAPRMLPVSSGTIEQMAWRPDGRAVYINSHPGTSIVAEQSGTISAVDLASGQETTLVPAPAHVSVEARMTMSVGGDLAYHGYTGRDPWLHSHNVTLLSGAQTRNLTGTLDLDIKAFGWTADGKALLVGAYEHVRSALWRVPLQGAARRVDTGPVQFEDFAIAAQGGDIAFIGSESNLPPELYVMRSLATTPVRLTHFHEALAQTRFGKVEAIGWSSDGFQHTGVITYPPDYLAAQRNPMLVHIHGGPHTSANIAFNGESQFFAAAGWVIFEPNYRGSSGEGEKYRTAVIGDATPGPGRDIRAGVDTMMARGGIDERRIAVTGYSYGGVMSSWMIGHYHDWCAAIPGGVVVDFADYYDQSNTGIWIESLLGSPHLQENRMKYREQSPVSALEQVTTPTLVLQNTGDPNAGVTQAYTLYHAIKDHGVKSRMVIFGVDGHGLEDPFLERKSRALTLSWMQENCAAGGGS